MLLERLLLSRLYHLDHLYGLLLTFGLALIIQGVFRNFYGISGLPYQIPASLSGGRNLGFMFLPNYRGWVIVRLRRGLLRHLVHDRKDPARCLSARRHENPGAGRGLRHHVPLMITLTYGFGVALAGFAGVLAAPIYSVNPNMGADLMIVVFAVVVIGGMGFDPGCHNHRLRPRHRRGADAGVLPRGLCRGDLRDHGNRVIDQARGAVWEGRIMAKSETSMAQAMAKSAGMPGLHKAIFAALLAVLLVLPFFVYPVFAMKLMCFALFAAAFNLLLGFGGLLSFGHAAYFGTASYVAAHAAKHWGLTPELAVLSGTIAAALLGLIIGSLSIRRQGIYFAMVTLAFAQMVYFLALQAEFTGGEDGIQSVPRGDLFGLIPLHDNIALYFFVLALTFGGVLMLYRITHSPFGEVLKAIRENEPRAISLGYNVTRYKLMVFILSATFAGLAGAGEKPGVPARLADRCALGDVGRGGADDPAGRHGHHLRPAGRRRGDRDHAELPRRFRRLGDHHPGGDLRYRRDAVPRGDRGRAVALAEAPALNLLPARAARAGFHPNPGLTRGGFAR